MSRMAVVNERVAVILAGGVGTRVGMDIPKQLIKACRAKTSTGENPKRYEGAVLYSGQRYRGRRAEIELISVSMAWQVGGTHRTGVALS